MTISESAKRAAQICIEECGAGVFAFDDYGFSYHFAEHITEDKFPFEWRFQGALGFGGKLLHTRGEGFSVSCYPEDMTPERTAMIGRACGRLAALNGEIDK